MFKDTNAFSGFSADDVDKVRAFYADVLGIEVNEGPMGILELRLAGHEMPVIVYPKPDHVPAEFTVLNFTVDDVGAAVGELTERGVTIERYEGMPQDEDGVMRGNGPDIAWFRDPAGNVLSVIKPI